MSNIHVRIDADKKKAAKKVLDKIGLDMSSAVKLYINQIVITQGIPFRLLTENGLTVQQEQEILKDEEADEEGINVAGPFEGEEITNYLRKTVKKK